MNTNENGLTLEQGQPAKTPSKNTLYFIAICAIIISAATGYYLDRSIGAHAPEINAWKLSASSNKPPRHDERRMARDQKRGRAKA